MRKASIFVLGFCIGILLCTVLLYVLSIVFEQFAVQLFESEADQQKEF